MVSQWSNTHCGNACPDVAARSVPVKPKDSMTGQVRLQVEDGRARPLRLLEHVPALLVEHAVDAAQGLRKPSQATPVSARTHCKRPSIPDRASVSVLCTCRPGHANLHSGDAGWRQIRHQHLAHQSAYIGPCVCASVNPGSPSRFTLAPMHE